MIWVHRGEQLDSCKAIRLNYDFVKLLFARMEKFGWKFGQRFDKKGKLKPHG